MSLSPRPAQGSTPAPVRPGPLSVSIVAGAGALLLAAIVPLGLASGDAVDQVAQAFGVARPFSASNAPLVDVLMRFMALIPMGEAGVRAHAVAALAGVGALTLLMSRAALSPSAGGPLPAAAGIALLALSRPFLEIACLRPAAAVDLCLLAGAALALERVRREPGGAGAGLTLALLCGAAAGAGWPVRATMWPLALGATAWSLRRGWRWPLLAPTLFVGGAAVTLVAAAIALPGDAGEITARAVASRILFPLPHPMGDGLDVAGRRAILAWIVDDVGVMGLLLAGLGWAVLGLRSRGEALWSALPWTAAVAACLWIGNVSLARLFVVAGAVVPLGVALAFLAGSFGRARGAAAIVMLVIVVLPPAVVGMGAALALPARRTPAAVGRRLTATFAGLPGAAPPPRPQDEETTRWWRYARAIGEVDGDEVEVGGIDEIGLAAGRATSALGIPPARGGTPGRVRGVAPDPGGLYLP